MAFDVSIRHPRIIEKPYKFSKEEVEPWLNMLSHNQFTIPEIESGLAYKILNE